MSSFSFLGHHDCARVDASAESSSLEQNVRNPDASTTFEIRLARPEDGPTLQAVELDAAQRYGAVDEMRFCVELSARSADEHGRARDQGLALIAEIGERAIGFVLSIPVDGRAHILEIAVASGHPGRGCGRALIAAAEDWAARKGFHEITLTTFRDVAWNAPFYARLGYDAFEVGSDRPELGPLIAEVMAAGIHRTPRVAMRKELSGKFGLGSSIDFRQEWAGEFREIHELVRDAFQTAHYAEGDEQDFVDAQRNAESYLPELALVLENDGRLIAHIMLTQGAISTTTGPYPILLLACVAVDAEHRNRGIGTAFIEAALQRACNLGHSAVILVGDPAYYRRLGFVPSIQFGITNENGIEPEYVQVRELAPGALCGASGRILLPN